MIETSRMQATRKLVPVTADVSAKETHALLDNPIIRFYDFRMIDRKMTVTEAARHFADLVNRTYYRGESTVLLRSGEPVAMMVPVGGSTVTGRDWLSRWRSIPHLDIEDADDFAAGIEESRDNLTPPASPWD